MDVRAEVEKLARALDVEPAELQALERLDAETVQQLRFDVTDGMFEAGRKHFARIAAAAKILPGSVSAKLAQHALGPLLSARTAALLERDQAQDLARRLPSRFLADIAVEIDVRHAGAIIGAVSADRIARAAAHLEERGEYVAMGGFVHCLDDEALTAVLDVLSDDSLVRVAFLLDDPSRIEHVLSMLPPDRRARLEAVRDAA